MTHGTQPHYIRDNKAARVPSRLIVVTTETTSDRGATGETQRWRCAVAVYVHWTAKGFRHRDVRTYTSPKELWADVAAFVRPKRRTVLYAHNLPFEMRITQALKWLPANKFTLTAIRLSAKGTWSKWSYNKATLTLCDSASLFPVTLYTLGKIWQLPKLGKPKDDAIESWLECCKRSATILGKTLVSYFEWLQTGAAGNWQVTGAGQSWAHWRHVHYTHQVLVHGDATAREAERRAMFTGRAENWQWGKDLTAPVYEWDWANAYPRLARDHPVPTRLSGMSNTVAVRDLERLQRRWIILADLTVTTDAPVVPARRDGRILWPVGTFETTLWGPEIDLLRRSGGTFTIQRVWLYRSEPALEQWGRWILSQLNGPDDTRPPWGAILLKHWSRALIGRFSTQYQQWELLGHDPIERVTTGRIHDVRTGEETDFMQIGHELHVMTGVTESDDSCPQITSYIMSLARVQLWEAAQAAGPDNVLYMDTDSVVVNPAGNVRLESATAAGRFNGLRVKSRQRGYEIYGPRAALIGGETKLSGVPRNPQRTGPITFEGEVWTSLEGALANGQFDSVSITRRRYTVRWNDFRRARLAGGRTAPYSLPEYRSTGIGRNAELRTNDDKIGYAEKALAARPGKRAIRNGRDAIADIVRIAGTA